MSKTYAALIAAAMLCSCSSSKPPEGMTEWACTRPFNVRVMSPEAAKAFSEEATMLKGAVACRVHNGVREGVDLIVVPWDKDTPRDQLGRLLPDFFALGHEVWHSEDLGGHLFHGNEWLANYDGWEGRRLRVEEAKRLERLAAQQEAGQ